MRAYLFCVIGAAVFLVALALGTQPASHEPPSAVLTRAGQALAFGDHAARDLVSDARVAKALAQHPGVSAAELAANLDVVQEPARDGRRARLTVAYRGTSANTADAVNALVDSYVEEHSTRAERGARLRHSQAEQALDAAQRSAASAQRQLDKFRRAHADLLVEPAAEPVVSEQPTPRALNPAWADADQVLRNLAAQRDELLTRFTPAHPLVLQLEDQIAAASRRVAALPQWSASSAASPANNTPQRLAIDRIERGKQIAMLRQYEHQAQLAESLHDEALADVDEARQAMRRAADNHIDVEQWAATPANSRRSSIPALLMALVLASAIGGGFATQSVPDDPTVRTPDEAARLLELPAIGTLAPSPRAAEAYRMQLPRGVRYAKFAGEATLALFALGLVVLAVFDGDYLVRLMSHPLSALPNALGRLGG